MRPGKPDSLAIAPTMSPGRTPCSRPTSTNKRVMPSSRNERSRGAPRPPRLSRSPSRLSRRRSPRSRRSRRDSSSNSGACNGSAAFKSGSDSNSLKAAAANSVGEYSCAKSSATITYCSKPPSSLCRSISSRKVSLKASRRRATTSAIVGKRIRCTGDDVRRSIVFSWRRSRGVTKVIATPERPARPVRPMR